MLGMFTVVLTVFLKLHLSWTAEEGITKQVFISLVIKIHLIHCLYYSLVDKNSFSESGSFYRVFEFA